MTEDRTLLQRTVRALKGRARTRRERLANLDRRLDALVFVAALLSIPPALQRGDLTGAIVVIDIVAWAIFVFEAVVKWSAHGRDDYLRNRWNWLDLGIIVLSAPYHLATGIPLIARLGSFARLARLIRIALVFIKLLRGGRALLSRSNVPAVGGLVALATMLTAGLVYLVEGVEQGGQYDSFADALWWAVVTLTTVGYGDLSPSTDVGRVAAVFLMLVGIAFLGTIAASLASVFVDDGADEREHELEVELRAIRAEVGELRRSVEALTAKLDDP